MTSPSGQLLAQALCGWRKTAAAYSDQEISSIGESLNTRLELSATQTTRNSACFGILSTEDNKQSPSVSATIIGDPRWECPEWQKIAREQSNTEALIVAYQETGRDCVKKIAGSFSFVVLDHDNDQVFAAVDRMNRYPLYYANTNKGIAVASSVRALFALEFIPRRIKPQGIYNYVYFHIVPSADTLYQDVHKITAGHSLWGDSAELGCQRYWDVEFKEETSASTDELADEFRSLLRVAVSDEYRSNLNNGSFLSGGLDSSTITGVLSEQHSCPAYSMGFSAEGYDEIAFARSAAQHFGVSLHEYYVQPQDIVEALPKVAAAFDEPFGNSSALPTYLCAQFAAQNGTERLLAGDGGDELFAGNERYAKQRVFEHYQKAPEAFRAHILEPVISSLPNGLPLVSKAQSYISQASTPLPDRLQSYNFLHRNQPQEVFEPDFLEECCVESPLDLLRDIYNTPSDASPLNRMMFMDWQITLADNDLRKVSRMCELAGVEVGYPLLHDELVAFSTRVPSHIKLKDNQLRDFFKQSLTGWLPDSTINKSKHGFGLPFGLWMRDYDPLKDMAYNTLEQIKSRGFFRPEFIDNALQQHREGHAAYYGELVWLLMTLELWLQAHDF